MIEGLEAGDDLVTGQRIVKRGRNAMKCVGMGRLFHQRGGGAQEDAILFKPDYSQIMIEACRAVLQTRRARLFHDIQETGFKSG